MHSKQSQRGLKQCRLIWETPVRPYLVRPASAGSAPGGVASGTRPKRTRFCCQTRVSGCQQRPARVTGGRFSTRPRCVTPRRTPGRRRALCAPRRKSTRRNRASRLRQARPAHLSPRAPPRPCPPARAAREALGPSRRGSPRGGLTLKRNGPSPPPWCRCPPRRRTPLRTRRCPSSGRR